MNKIEEIETILRLAVKILENADNTIKKYELEKELKMMGEGDRNAKSAMDKISRR